MTNELTQCRPFGRCVAARLASVSVVANGRPLLSDVTFEIAKGSVTAIIGPNGAGKSTLIAVLAGDIRIESGVVEYCDSTADARCHDPAAASIVTPDAKPRVESGRLDEYESVATLRVKDLAQRRSVLVQQSAVAFSYTVREVVSMGRAAWGVSASERDEDIVNNAMAQTDTRRLANREVTTLSGGENARVAVARVLAQNTPIVLLDEPTAALDIAHQERVLGLARSLANAGGSVVVVIHDLDAAAAHADDVVAMSEGRVVASGPAQNVMTSTILTRVYEHPIDVVTHPLTTRPIVVPRRAQDLFESGSLSAAARNSGDQINEGREDHRPKEIRKERVMERRSSYVERGEIGV